MRSRPSRRSGMHGVRLIYLSQFIGFYRFWLRQYAASSALARAGILRRFPRGPATIGMRISQKKVEDPACLQRHTPIPAIVLP